MSVAIPIPLLQNLPDVNVTPAVGVDEYALVYDHDTARFVLRAPFAGLLATGATVGATAQAQAFTNGIIGPSWKPAADAEIALKITNASGASLMTLDSRYGAFGFGEAGHSNIRVLVGGTKDRGAGINNSCYGYYSGTLTLSPNDAGDAFHIFVGDGYVNAPAGETIPGAFGIMSEAMKKTGSGTITSTYGIMVNASAIGVNNYAALFNGPVGIGGNDKAVNLNVSSPTGAVLQLKSTLDTMIVGSVLGKIQFYTSDPTAVGVGAHIAAVCADTYGEQIDIIAATAYPPGGGEPVERMRIKGQNGNVGIGTPTPSGRLHVQDACPVLILQDTSTAVIAQDTYAQIEFRSSDPSMVGGIAAKIDSHDDWPATPSYGNWGSLRFYTNNGTALAERLRIASNGKVGINDTAPAELLDVNGNINTTGVVKVDDVQVISNRVIDARCADVANSGDATTDGLIDALRDAMVAHGLIAAA